MWIEIVSSAMAWAAPRSWNGHEIKPVTGNHQLPYDWSPSASPRVAAQCSTQAWQNILPNSSYVWECLVMARVESVPSMYLQMKYLQVIMVDMQCYGVIAGFNFLPVGVRPKSVIKSRFKASIFRWSFRPIMEISWNLCRDSAYLTTI